MCANQVGSFALGVIMLGTGNNHVAIFNGLFAAKLASELPAMYCLGRKIEKAVPWLSCPVLLFTWIVPRCFSKIPRVIHNPRPVPTSFLVVKNGWKMFLLCFGSIPLPVSKMVIRTPSK